MQFKKKKSQLSNQYFCTTMHLMHLNQHFNLRRQNGMTSLEVLYAGLKTYNSPMKTIWQSMTFKLDSVSFTSVSALLLQLYTGPL